MKKITEESKQVAADSLANEPAEDGWTLSPAEKEQLSADKPEDRGRPNPIRAHEDASHAMPDPVPAIEALAHAQAAATLISLAQQNGIGIAATGDGLIVYSNNRLWRSLADALGRHAAAIAVAMPDQLGICSAEIRVVGRILDRPPGPVEVARPVIEPRPSWNGGPPESELLQAWIDGAIKAAAYHHTAEDPGWTPEQLGRARERLVAIMEAGDQVESSSNYRIVVRKRCGGGTVEVRRFDD